MIALIKVAQFAQQVMVAQLFTVVAGEDDQGVVQLTRFLQVVEHAAQLGIDFAHPPVVGGSHLSNFSVVHAASQTVSVLEEFLAFDIVQVELQQGMLFGLGIY